MARTLTRPAAGSPNSTTRRVALVTRVSTRRQAENDEGSLKTQLQLLNAYVDFKCASGEDYRIVATYQLAAVSGEHALQCPDMLRLQRDLTGGAVNTVLCTKLDRASRNVSEFLQFVELLNATGAEFVSLKEHVDTTSPQGKLILTVLIALAQFEREQTAERTRDAMAARAQRGLFNGGVVLGLDPDPGQKGHLIVNGPEAQTVHFAFEAYRSRGSLTRTRDALNESGYRTKAYTSRSGQVHKGKLFRVSQVQYLLKNPVYIGMKAIGRPGDPDYQLVPGAWPAILETELFDEVQALMKKNGQTRTNEAQAVRHAFVLNRGLLCCGACGTQMEGRSGTGRAKVVYFYYVCKRKGCGMRVVAHEIEGAILERLRTLATTPDLLDGIVAATNHRLQRQLPVLGKRRRALLRDLGEVKREQDRLIGNWDELQATEARGLVSEKLNGLVARQQQIDAAIAEVDGTISQVQATRVDAATVRGALANITEIYQHLQPHQRKELFGLIVHRAEVHANEIRLELHSAALSCGAEGLGAGGTVGQVKSRFELPNRLPERGGNPNFFHFDRVCGPEPRLEIVPRPIFSSRGRSPTDVCESRARGHP
jgi:site-specific DNA recombinase